MFDTKKVADTYDQIGLYFSATRPKLSDEVISMLPALFPDASVLDLGCGNGVLLTALDRRSLFDHRSLGEVGGEGGSPNYLGVDISPVLLTEAKKLHPNHRFLLADITNPATWETLPQYDFIAALAVFHHLLDPQKHQHLLSQIKSHLKPHGSALISVWNLNQPKFTKYQDAQNPKLFAIPFHSGPKRDFYAFAPDELPPLAEKAGFTDIKTTTTKNNLYLRLD